ncbi:hypothetical protein EB796_005177 [Bugula neritina]|uniref:Helicase ATP-binding domain-containing protein n=1 Tax=Bugula neritina TaxID=10212 RepID=A0A7J7KF45_BUGNE|nr:hypothetical protein EB796_005177 [Bugula neritina]
MWKTCQYMITESSKSKQGYVPREFDFSNLLKVSTLPATYELAVERDYRTGEVLAFTERVNSASGGSAADSFSMLRAPEPGSGVKGSSSNLPFWPGGFDPPLDTSVDPPTTEWKEYRMVAPGLPGGLTAADTSTSPADIKLTDLHSPENLFEFDSSGDDESDGEEAGSSAAAMLPEDGDGVDDVIEELTKDAKVLILSDMKTVVPEVKDTEFAVRLSVTEPIEDFYQRVPDMAYKWPFELDVFQKQAVLCLESHENVFVAAHTSAGKTVVAEYAIALCKKHMTRAIYTSPIKALSNQKFRDFKLTFEDVGLITGDIQLNPEATCLIMTTEILRSMLYGGSDIIRDVEWVIFDERGVVWEEVIIMLPEHVNIILLSATVPNYMDFASWVGRTKKRKVHVVCTSKRPVPLEHFLYTGNSAKTSKELFLLVDSNSKLQELGYKKALAAKKERASSRSHTTGPKGIRTSGNFSSDKNVWLSVIEMLRKNDKLPAVAFTFSKKRIDENSSHLTSVDLTSSVEKSKIHVFIKRSIDRLKGTDKELPQVKYVSNLLSRGIGIHHSGVLPILKEIVELLFQQGLLKILFATETFAMGVNMPARTVVFDSIRKHDGINFRDLKPAEYIQ